MVYMVMNILVRLYLRNFLKKHNSQINLTEYGMKLESIIQSAVAKGDISIVAKNQMLKSKFWSGLRDPLLKNSSKYKFDTTTDFDQLRQLSLNWQIQIKVLPLCNTNLYHQIPKNLMTF